jgi:protocatechuate 3,4-dioxygenase alpha subunit
MAALGLTPSQTVGPYFSIGMDRRVENELVEPGSAGAIRIAGRVIDGAGDGVPDAVVEVWQAGADGTYRSDWGWGRSGADAQGGYSFSTVKPGPVPGPGGTTQAPHLVLLVFSRGMLKPLLTRMYFPDEAEANAADPVLSAIPDDGDRATLVATAEGGDVRFDVHLQGDRQTTFFALR